MKILTDAQRKVLRYITAYQVEHDGISPTLAELKGLLQVKSDNGVWKHMRHLIEAGELDVVKDRHRGISITKNAKQMLAYKWLNPLPPEPNESREEEALSATDVPEGQAA